MNIEFRVFARLATRILEIVNAPDANPVLCAVYQASCEQVFTRYLNAHTAVDDATTRASEATTRVEGGLEKMEQQFRIGRSALATISPDTKLPDTLKSQPTDTDKRTATLRLIELITPHAGQAWADALLQGTFHQTALDYVERLNASITAQNALQSAKTERAAAFEPAWGPYINFKRLVRDTLGSTSRQYRRIHVRSASSAEEESTTAEDVAENEAESEAEAETATEAATKPATEAAVATATKPATKPVTETAPPASEAAPSVA